MATKKKLIEKIEKGKGGVLHAATALPDGTYGKDELIARDEARAEQYVKQYQTTSMGPGDKAPIPGDKLKPTKSAVVNYGGK